MKTEFDSTYPTRLDGIISPDEFELSINRINRTMISNRTSLRFLQVLVSVTTITGIVLIIISAIKKKSKTSSHLFFPLSIAGAVIIAAGAIVYALSVCYIYTQRSRRIRGIIEHESTEYSKKLPIPSTWRLDSLPDYANNDNRYIDHVNTKKNVRISMKLFVFLVSY